MADLYMSDGRLRHSFYYHSPDVAAIKQRDTKQTTAFVEYYAVAAL